jgi:hypothetical protein
MPLICNGISRTEYKENGISCEICRFNASSFHAQRAVAGRSKPTEYRVLDTPKLPSTEYSVEAGPRKMRRGGTALTVPPAGGLGAVRMPGIGVPRGEISDDEDGQRNFNHGQSSGRDPGREATRSAALPSGHESS